MSSVMDNNENSLEESALGSAVMNYRLKSDGKKVYHSLPRRADGLPKIPYMTLAINMIIGFAFFTFYRQYIEAEAFTIGLDYFEPEFQAYYMRLLYIQLPLIIALGAVGVLYIWFSRPEDVSKMSPTQELSTYYLIFGVLAISGLFAVVVFGIYVEADAAWHQVAIRDTDFTPTHISLFYMAIPVACVALACSALWIHTRMPDFKSRISMPLVMVAGAPLLIMPNLGLNEWGHTFFYAEELFAAPIHWGFVVLGWGLFGIGGFIIQCVSRVKILTDLPDANAPSTPAKAAA